LLEEARDDSNAITGCCPDEVSDFIPIALHVDASPDDRERTGIVTKFDSTV
jgi:hypothetical protein